ncbi:MFS transporter [Amycolatopsis sp. NPDC059021]|uniref:MFS transporter n=1 Tax=Amycolatopsis sp. NPDC059021 TaxID=3346704 RepID=UPI00366C6003
MSVSTTPSPALAPALPRFGWLAVIAVTLGIFSIVTTEILPIGLLTPIGSAFGLSDGTAGLMMTTPGILAAIAAPVVTVATARLDRRLMLGVLMLVLAAADLLAAVAPDYPVMMVSRVLVGIVIGAFWSIAAGLAERLVPRERVARATAVIFSAVPLGSVIGVPAGTFIGAQWGWRAAFAVMGALTLGVLAALAAFVPALPARRVTRLDVLGGMLRTREVRWALLVTVLIVLAHFGTYTYVTPLLEQVTHAGPALITVLLFGYGVAGITGNFVAGAAVARHPKATFVISALMIACATTALPFAGRSVFGAATVLVVWGLAYGAVPVCSQTWFAHAAPRTPEAASVLFTSSFQATFSLGALAGGMVVDASSVRTVMLAGGAAALAMAACVPLSSRRRRASTIWNHDGER